MLPFALQQNVAQELMQPHMKTELPPDYLELEKRVDALKQVHQKLLQVTYVRYSPTTDSRLPALTDLVLQISVHE